ncbi:MAG: hypothetical protein AB7Y46_10825 [Armatimonadota bacterium]
MRPITVALMLCAFALSAIAQELTPEMLFERYPPNEEALNPGFHWAPEFSRTPSMPQRARFAVRVDWPEGVELARSPVTFGVPFADGTLDSVEHARLVTADGTAVPAQFEATATWWRRDGPVRWALVSATLERVTDYFVEYGTQVSAPPAEGMTVTETADAIAIDTGPLQATISKTRPTLLDAAIVNGQAIITPQDAAANLPTVVGGDGTEYPASADGLQVSFIRRGPLETVIRREGWYTAPAGRRYCQFITYTWLFAGSAAVRHDHTLVVAFDTTQNQIRDIRLAVPVSGGVTSATLSLDDGAGQPLVCAQDTLPVRVVQTAADACAITGASGAPVTATRAEGWAGGRRADGAGGFVAVRDFWEQFPMELEVTSDAVVAHLWPRHDAPVLDFTPSAVMGEEYPGDQVFWQDFYRGGLDTWTQGYGIGKTHNLLLSFFGSTAEQSFLAQSLARVFDQPVLAYADPEYACDTWAFGRVAAADPEQAPQIEALINAIMHRKYWLRDRLGNYGWINFGDVNYNLTNATDPETITYGHWRHWAQMFYGGPNAYPLLFMRSGRRDAWDFHRVNARHIMDFDICHLDSDESLHFRFPKIKGGRYGGNGGICHYAANIYPLGPDCHVRFMLWDWYLNGNPRAWEVFREFANQNAARRHEPANNRYLHRQTGGGLRLFAEAYEATWDPAYLSCAHQLAEILYGAQSDLGFTRYDDVYMNEGKVKYYQLTGDPRMLELFLNDMRTLSRRRDADVFADPRHTTLWGLAHAYWFTGDRTFLPYAMWQYAVGTSRVPTTGEPHQIGAVGWTFEHAYESTLGNQLPTFAALLRDVTDPPLPAGPTASGNGPIYLREDADGEFTVQLEVALYQSIPGLGAAPFSNWEEWVQRLPEGDRPALAVMGPDGAGLTRVDLLTGASSEPALAADTGATRSTITITVPPDGRTGTYALVPTSQCVPLRLKVLDPGLAHVVHATDQWWVHGASQYFLVPAGTGAFSLELKGIMLRSEIEVTVRNGQGEQVAQAHWSAGSDCRQDWERFDLDAGRPAQDEVWSISYLAPMASFLHFEGVPGVVGSAPDELFVPDHTSQPPAVTQPEGDVPGWVDSPLGAGQALSLPPAITLALASPDGAPLLNEAEGTVEMWVRDCRPHTDLHNRGLIRCGALNIYRRIGVGTYIYMGPGHQTGMVLPQGRWAHLAATWQPSTREQGGTEVALFIDGVRVETTYNRHITPAAGWAGTELTIPAAEVGVFIDELRVSDVVRYQGSFDRPQAPFDPDEHTLVLSHFDGGYEALVRGTPTHWQQR